MCDEDDLPVFLNSNINILHMDMSKWPKPYRVRFFSQTGEISKHVRRVIPDSVLRGRIPKIDHVRIISEGQNSAVGNIAA